MTTKLKQALSPVIENPGSVARIACVDATMTTLVRMKKQNLCLRVVPVLFFFICNYMRSIPFLHLAEKIIIISQAALNL